MVPVVGDPFPLGFPIVNERRNSYKHCQSSYKCGLPGIAIYTSNICLCTKTMSGAEAEQMTFTCHAIVGTPALNL